MTKIIDAVEDLQMWLALLGVEAGALEITVTLPNRRTQARVGQSLLDECKELDRGVRKKWWSADFVQCIFDTPIRILVVPSCPTCGRPNHE